MTHSDRSPAAALLLGIALVVSALILSGTWKDHQKSNQTLDVSGSAEKPIVSDLGRDCLDQAHIRRFDLEAL